MGLRIYLFLSFPGITDLLVQRCAFREQWSKEEYLAVYLRAQLVAHFKLIGSMDKDSEIIIFISANATKLTVLFYILENKINIQKEGCELEK